MANKKDHIDKSQEYQRYLENQMSAKERHAFEMRMLEDDFEREAMEGMEQFSAEEIGSDLNQLKNELHKKTNPKNRFIYWRAAATIILLGVFSFFIYYVLDTNSKTEVADNLKIPAMEQKDEGTQITNTPDSIKPPEPTIAYNQDFEKAEDKSDVLMEKSTIETKESAEVHIMDQMVNSEDDIQDEVMVDIKTPPLEPPTLAYESEPEMAEEIILQMPEEQPKMEERKSDSFAKKSASAGAMSRSTLSPDNLQTITGRVTSLEDDEGLPGVNVVLKGSSYGTVSDIEGNYSIEVPKAYEAILVYSAVGYISEEVDVSGLNEVDVNIEPDVTALSEIVVIGYATEQKRDITGSVSSVEMDADQNNYSYIPPMPVDGNSTFRDFVKENLRYPGSGLEEGIKGTVKLKFTVKANGEISNMEVLKSLGEAFDKEAIRLVNDGPDWEPAELNGETVAREVKVKIRFRVPE